MLTDILDCRDLPVGNTLCRRHRAGFAFNGLTHRQCDTRAGLG
ncbi:hypothetical protein SRABI106_04717 [Rahnella aquatilis]|nr:hypothetical protein SRABI106_04717 [Rahnella aquatilis]